MHTILSLCNVLFLCTSTYLPFCISSTTSEMFLINLIKVRHFVHIGVITTKQIRISICIGKYHKMIQITNYHDIINPKLDTLKCYY